MTEYFPNLIRGKVMQVQEAQRVPIEKNLKRPTARNIIINLTKFKDKENFKGSKGETASNIKGTPIKLSADFSTETLQARRDWHKIFQVMKSKDLQPR